MRSKILNNPEPDYQPTVEPRPDRPALAPDLPPPINNGNRNKRRILWRYRLIIAGLVLLLLIVGGKYLSLRRQVSANDPEQQQEQLKQELADLLPKIKKHILLPEQETPILATINDAEKLIKEQPFYEGAQNGDRVLIYQAEHRAIVYSPARDLIVNAGPIYLDETAAAAEKTAAPAPAPTAPAKSAPGTSVKH